VQSVMPLPEQGRQKVGGVHTADRPMAMYTPEREPVFYERGSTWIVIAILAILFLVFFGFFVFFR